ncbi:ATP-binding region, ATPase-like domain protein [Candidatus Magnetoovum chiemensis]|nr:ATP-binding region, ATPase-like domain protein [Candidatus Magnetoovum chiemensis]
MTVSLKEVEINEQQAADLNINQGDYACLTVKDTGAGIPEDIKEKIFEPFFTTKQKGICCKVHNYLMNLCGISFG